MERKGKWGGVTAELIAKFMGCNVRTTKRYLYSLKKDLNREPLLEEITEMVYQYRYVQSMKNNQYLKINWL